MKGLVEITPREAVDAIREQAFTERDDDGTELRRLVHCWIGPFGADWDENAAIHAVETADRVAWADHLVWGWSLAIETGDGLRIFDTIKPPVWVTEDRVS